MCLGTYIYVTATTFPLPQNVLNRHFHQGQETDLFSNSCRLIFTGVSHKRSPMEDIILHLASFTQHVFEIYS